MWNNLQGAAKIVYPLTRDREVYSSDSDPHSE